MITFLRLVMGPILPNKIMEKLLYGTLKRLITLSLKSAQNPLFIAAHSV